MHTVPLVGGGVGSVVGVCVVGAKSGKSPSRLFLSSNLKTSVGLSAVN